MIATDGAKGVRGFARIPAGAELAAARAKEAACAATRLGVRQLHLRGLPDGGLASFDALGRQCAALVAIMDAVNRYLRHAWNGTEWLGPWNGALRDPGLFRR